MGIQMGEDGTKDDDGMMNDELSGALPTLITTVGFENRLLG